MRRLFATSVVLWGILAGQTAAEEIQAPLLPVWILAPEALTQSKSRLMAGDPSFAPALTRLREEAEAALRAGPFSVMQKTRVSPSGDRHDYLSQAPYFWPDSTKEKGLPYVRRDGKVNPESLAGTDRPALNAMASSVQTLALAYALTGENDYASHAARLLRCWFLDPATRMNPHLKYGQGIPGQIEGRGLGIIETRVLIGVLEGARLLEASPHWTAEDRQGLAAWCQAYLQWLENSPLGRQERQAGNNHGTWYDAQVVALALFVGQTEHARQELEAVKTRRIEVQIEPDGRQPHELGRTRSFFYSLVNLQALMVLADLGRRVEVDLWHYRSVEGRSLRGAWDYLAAYADPSAKWPHPELHLDRAVLLPFLQRAVAVYGEEHYQALLDRCFAEEKTASRGQLLYAHGLGGP